MFSILVVNSVPFQPKLAKMFYNRLGVEQTFFFFDNGKVKIYCNERITKGNKKPREALTIIKKKAVRKKRAKKTYQDKSNQTPPL